MSIAGDNLKKARKAAGLTQSAAGKLLGRKQSAVGAWEEGRALPSILIIPQIMRIYHITDWIGLLQDENFDPMNQSAGSFQCISLIEEKYKKLKPKLKKVVDEILNIS